MFTLLKILPLLLQQSSQIVYVESDVWTLRYVYKQVEYRQFFFIQALIMLMFFFVCCWKTLYKHFLHQSIRLLHHYILA